MNPQSAPRGWIGGIGGMPAVLWCRWIHFSDLLSWFELCNLIIALAQVACHVNRSFAIVQGPEFEGRELQEIFCKVRIAPLWSASYIHAGGVCAVQGLRALDPVLPRQAKDFLKLSRFLMCRVDCMVSMSMFELSHILHYRC